MAVTFELPQDIEQLLRDEFGNADRGAKEAVLVELYRQLKLTRQDLSCALGLSRLETETVLKQHNVTEDLPIESEHQAALARLQTDQK